MFQTKVRFDIGDTHLCTSSTVSKGWLTQYLNVYKFAQNGDKNYLDKLDVLTI